MSISSVQKDLPPSSDGNQEGSTQLLTMKVFECFSPPPMNSIRGTFIPRVLDVRKRRRRRVAIEVHLVPASKGEAKRTSDGASFYEECIVRVLDPANAEEKAAVLSAYKKNKKNQKQDFREVDADDFEDDTSVSPSYLHSESTNFTSCDSLAGWKQKYRFPISAISIKGTHNATVIVEISLDRAKETRELIFDSRGEAEQFEAMILREKSLENRRIEKKIEANFGDKAVNAGETITFLIEIVSGWNLPLGDFTSSDPYIKCWYNGNQVHKTKYISNALDPVWTIETGSLFLLSVDVCSLFGSEGLLCELHDFDSIGADEKLGQFSITPKQLYDAKGERMEFALQPVPGDTNSVTGHVAVRCRRATDFDIDFMKDFNKNTGKGSDFLGMKAFEKLAEGKGGAGAIASILSKRTKVAKHGENAGKKLYKIRPNPDPSRVDETSWMTRDAIQSECMKESLNWVDTGNGPVGRLFVEILGCDNLPQMDAGGMLGNKTDAFVQLVFEDTMGRTDTIDDSLAPRWMPWTKRAFILHMYHASSDLFIAVFDHDESINPADEHDFIGRAAVDLSNLRKNIVYTLTYDLYTTAQMSNLSDKKNFRKRMGTVTFRLRLEIEDERKLLLATLNPPPLMFVNVKARKDFKVLQAATEGKYNMSRYDQDIIYSYIDELLTLKHILMVVQDAVMALILWRGTFELQFGKDSLFVPVHSMTAFVIAITLVEKPQLLPSFGFFSVSWLLLASMDYRSRYPDVWGRCRTFSEFFQVLIFGETVTSPLVIEANATKQRAEAYVKEWKDRIKASEEAAAKAYAESAKEQEEHEREMEGVGDESDLATKNHGISIDPLKIVLHPIQQQLAMVVRYVRYVKYAILWQECYLSFWITVACLVMSVICSFVPWFFLLKWSMRFLVWTLFGPWMKLVDVFYVSKIKAMSPEEEEKYKREMKEKRLVINQGVIRQARLKREEARKIKAMKKHLFGKYIVGVPVLKVDRFIDFPLPESTATPYKVQRSLADLAMQDVGYKRVRIPGQHLVGDMIPKVESLSITDAPIGQATSQPNYLDKSRPGVSSGKDSTASVYASIGSLLFGAAILTWFGVPLLASMTEKLLKWVVSNKVTS